MVCGKFPFLNVLDVIEGRFEVPSYVSPGTPLFPLPSQLYVRLL